MLTALLLEELELAELLLLQTGDLLLALLALLELNGPLEPLPESENFVLPDAQIPLQDSEELALDAADVALAKDTRAHGPM